MTKYHFGFKVLFGAALFVSAPLLAEISFSDAKNLFAQAKPLDFSEFEVEEFWHGYRITKSSSRAYDWVATLTAVQTKPGDARIALFPDGKKDTLSFAERMAFYSPHKPYWAADSILIADHNAAVNFTPVPLRSTRPFPGINNILFDARTATYQGIPLVLVELRCSTPYLSPCVDGNNEILAFHGEPMVYYLMERKAANGSPNPNLFPRMAAPRSAPTPPPAQVTPRVPVIPPAKGSAFDEL